MTVKHTADVVTAVVDGGMDLRLRGNRTFAGNPLAVAAGLSTLRELNGDAYERLGTLTDSLATALREAAGDRPVQVASVPGLVTPFFSAEPVADFAGASAKDHLRAMSKLTARVDGQLRIVPRPPRIVPVEELFPATTTEAVEAKMRTMLRALR